MKTAKTRTLFISTAMLCVVLGLAYSQIAAPALAEASEVTESQVMLLGADDLE